MLQMLSPLKLKVCHFSVSGWCESVQQSSQYIKRVPLNFTDLALMQMICLTGHEEFLSTVLSQKSCIRTQKDPNETSVECLLRQSSCHRFQLVVQKRLARYQEHFSALKVISNALTCKGRCKNMNTNRIHERMGGFQPEGCQKINH